MKVVKLMKTTGNPRSSDQHRFSNSPLSPLSPPPPEGWTFAGETARAFNDHAPRHIPGYATGHALILELSDFFATGGAIYDLGCSTGVLLAGLATRHGHRCRVYGYDIELAMIEQARRTLGDLPAVAAVADVRRFEADGADLIVSYYVTQFLPVAERPAVLHAIHRALRPGGAFVWFEKTRATSATTEDIRNQLYADFKAGHGVDPAAVLAKTRSLRGVLEPLTAAENDALLGAAEFTETQVLQDILGFRGVLAIKDRRTAQ